MSGRKHLSAEQRAELGEAVLNARRGATPWKVLERLYQRSRWQLERYAASVAAAKCYNKVRNATN